MSTRAKLLFQQQPLSAWPLALQNSQEWGFHGLPIRGGKRKTRGAERGRSTSHAPRLRQKSGGRDEGRWERRGREPTADALGGPGDSRFQVPAQLCSPAVSPGTPRHPRQPSPLELVAPQDAAVGELDDGRVRDGFVGRHRGAAGAGGNGVPKPVTGVRGTGQGPGGVAERGKAAAPVRTAAAGTGEPVRGGGAGAPPRGQAAGRPPPLPGAHGPTLRGKGPAGLRGQAPPRDPFRAGPGAAPPALRRAAAGTWTPGGGAWVRGRGQGRGVERSGATAGLIPQHRWFPVT